MKIVISGGLGYVGGRLSQYLAKEGHEVVALSRQAQFLGNSLWPENLTVQSPDDLQTRSGQLKNTDVFIHLAALNEIECVKHPFKAIDVNITQTVQWLDLAYTNNVNKFIYFSTAHVYGKPLTGIYDERTLTRPIHPYAITHKCAEDYVIAYAQEKGMNNSVIRLTNSFGGPAFPTADRWTLLINDLCSSAVKQSKMTLLSDGTQVRDFICLQDVCRAVNHLVGRPGPSSDSIIYNLGSGYSRSVWDVACEIKALAEKVLEKNIVLERKQPPPTPPTDQLTISIDKLLGTGFTLTNNISEEITSTLHYFLQHPVNS